MQVIVFMGFFSRPGKSLVANQAYYEGIGGNYWVCEYDLGQICLHLKDPRRAPKPYAALFETWEKGRESRTKQPEASCEL